MRTSMTPFSWYDDETGGVRGGDGRLLVLLLLFWCRLVLRCLSCPCTLLFLSSSPPSVLVCVLPSSFPSSPFVLLNRFSTPGKLALPSLVPFAPLLFSTSAASGLQHTPSLIPRSPLHLLLHSLLHSPPSLTSLNLNGLQCDKGNVCHDSYGA